MTDYRMLRGVRIALFGIISLSPFFLWKNGINPSEEFMYLSVFGSFGLLLEYFMHKLRRRDERRK
jgi:hypothetical protein